MSTSLLDYLRILGLDSNTNLTIKDLKKTFREKVLEIHPDKGGNANDFDTLLSAFVYINNTISRVKGGRATLEEIKSPEELQADRIEEFIESVFEEFNRDNFNREFDKLHISGLNDGYSQWLSSDLGADSDSSDSDKILDYQKLLEQINIPKSSDLSENGDINNIFVREAKKGKPEPQSIILHPNAMAYYKGTLLGANILDERPESYSSDFLANPEFSDLYQAYTQDNTICDKVSNIFPIKTYDDLIQERNATIIPYTDEEQEILLKYERNMLEKEKERMNKVKEEFGNNIYKNNTISNTSENFIIKIG